MCPVRSVSDPCAQSAILALRVPSPQCQRSVCPVVQDTLDLKAELARKDELIKKTQEKIAMWKGTLAEVQHPRGPADLPQMQDVQVQAAAGSCAILGTSDANL